MKSYRMIKMLVEAAAVTSLTGMLLVVCLQVFARFALPSAPAWTEELSRILFVYSIAFGVGLAVDRGEMVRLSIVEQYLSGRSIRRLTGVCRIVIVLVSVAIALYAVPFVQIGHTELSPVLGIRMSLVFASALVMMVIVALFSLYKLVHDQGGEDIPS